MADVEAKIIVSVVDKATKALTEINKSVGGLDKLINDNSKQIRNFGLAATAAGGAITVALGLSVNAAREQIAAEKQLNAVLASTKGAAGLTANELKRMASELQNVTNFGDETILAAQGIILQFTNIGKNIFPQVAEAALDVSQRLGRDLTSTALQLGKALNNPAEAMNALSRAGVQLTESQGEVIKALAESGHMAEAQQMLLDELAQKYGGAARAAADPFIQLKNAMSDVSEEVGVALIPALTALIQSVLPVVQQTTFWLQQNPELTKTIVIMTAAIGVLLTTVGSLSLGLVAVNAGLAAIGVSLAAGGALFVALTGIIALIIVVTQHWEGLKWMAGNAVDYMIERVQAFGQTIEDTKNQFIAFFELVNLRLSQLKGKIFGPAAPGSDPFNPFVPDAKPRAGGGRVSEDLTLVGEQGPELVSLPRGSFVHTAGESSRMMGGVTIGSIHVHNEADENRLIDKLTRMMQLQSLASV